MPTTIDIGKLRQSSNDNSTFNYLMQNDTDFADRVKYVQDNNELSPFEKMKFPSVMLDAYEGVNRGSTMDETATMLDNSMKNAEKSASKQLVEDPMSFALETVKNIPSSTANLVGGVASAVASPLQTGKTIFKAGVGGAVNTIESIADLAGVKNAEEIFDLSSEDTAKAIGDFYVQRYGNIESAAKTLRDDPAGFFSDLGAVVSGAGGLLKGGASLVGGVTGASTRTATKLGALGKGLNIAQDIGTQMVKAGYNMEPLVITGKGVVLAGRGVRGVANATMNAVSPSAITTRALKINPSDIQAFKNLPGDELPGEFLLRKGILGGGDLSITPSQGVEFTGSLPMGRTMPGIMRDLERVADKAKSTVDTLLSGVKETYDLVDEVPDAPQIIGEMKKIAERYDLRDPANILNGLLDKGRVTLSDVNQLKRLAYDFFNTYKKSNVANDSFSAQQIIQYERSLRKFIEDQAQIKGLPDIGVLNQDTMKATELLNSMQSAQLSSLSKGKNALSLMDTLTGFGAFGITQDPFATAGIIIARRMAESTLFKTTIAKYLDKLDITKFNILKNAIKSGKHTQESKKILRNVVSKTAEEMKSKLDADQENIEAFNLRAQKNTQEASLQQVQEPILQEIQPSPTTLPQETSPVKGVERVMDRMDKKLGMVDEGLKVSTDKIAGVPDELQGLAKEAKGQTLAEFINNRKVDKILKRSKGDSTDFTAEAKISGIPDELQGLAQEAKGKTLDEFLKGQSLYHGTPYDLEGGVLKFGAGKQMKKGGYMGGHFFTDTPEIADNFSFGGKVYQASGEIKNKVLDVNKSKKLFKDFVGKKYKTSDGDLVEFTKQEFDYMFPKGKADWSTLNTDLAEQIAKKQGKIGVAIPEYAGGKQGMTYQIFEDNIPVKTKSQLTDLWNKVNSPSK